MFDYSHRSQPFPVTSGLFLGQNRTMHHTSASGDARARDPSIVLYCRVEITESSGQSFYMRRYARAFATRKHSWRLNEVFAQMR